MWHDPLTPKDIAKDRFFKHTSANYSQVYFSTGGCLRPPVISKVYIPQVYMDYFS